MPNPTSYLLKKPSPREKRRSFSIVARSRLPDGRARGKTVNLAELDTVNKLLHRGELDEETAEARAREILRALYQSHGPHPPRHRRPPNESNAKLIARYWASCYSDRELVDERTARYELERAARAIGDLVLASTSAGELQAAVNRSYSGNRQRRIVKSLNQLLRFIGRDIKLKKQRRERRPVRHLTERELDILLEHISDWPSRVLHAVAFFSGLRAGEIFALRSENLFEKGVDVRAQVDKNGVRRCTKTRTDRRAYVQPEHLHWVKAWIAIADVNKAKLRRAGLSKLTRRACSLAFPESPDRWCRFHDLRHSYAIHLLSKGVPLSLVAKSLGNSHAVCEEYYTGFTLTDALIDAIDAAVARAEAHQAPPHLRENLSSKNAANRE